MGDKSIDLYSRQDANCVRDILFRRSLSKESVKGMFGSIRALVNFVIRELGLSDITAFSGIYLGEDNQIETRRKPVPLNYIRSIQKECEQVNDEGRWLIALLSDSGMRRREAIGLHKDYVMLDAENPHIILKPHPRRRLKNLSSHRVIRLDGSALSAVGQAIQSSSTDLLFPKYCYETKCNSNSASAAFNKWMSPRVPSGYVIHSFRHSLRDRLRAAECTQDMTDRLCGRSLNSVGETYGAGYPLKVLSRWMNKAFG